MTFTTMQQVYDALPGYQTRFMMTTNSGSGTSRVAPQRQASSPGAVIPPVLFGVSPVSPGATCDRTKVGALALPNVLSGHMLRVARARSQTDISTPAWWMLTDRLAECAFDPSLATVQNLNTVALPARAPTNGVGVQMAFECLTSVATLSGATAGTFQVTYTNDQGGTSVVSFTNSAPWNNFGGGTRENPVPLAAGDQGVRSVQSIQITSGAATSSGTSIYGVVLYVPVLMFNYAWHYEQSNPAGSEQQDWTDTALVPFDPDACLEFLTAGPTTSGFSVELDLVMD